MAPSGQTNNAAHYTFYLFPFAGLSALEYARSYPIQVIFSIYFKKIHQIYLAERSGQGCLRQMRYKFTG